MTQKQHEFCRAYIANKYNATQAYEQVFGCSKENALKNSYRMLKNPEVRAEITKLIDELYEDYFVSGNRIAAELSYMAFVKEDVKDSDKLKALDLLQKQLGLQSQRLEANVKSDSIKIVIGGEENEDAEG